MARSVCGEGMPNFYAREIIQKGTYCVGPYADFIAKPIMNMFGACKSIEEYGFRKDQDGNPLIEDCQKNSFFIYYTTPESWAIFRAMYFNYYGMQDKYVEYWGHVAEKLANNKYVVGFDPFNEPLPSWVGLIDTLWTIMPQSGHFDRYDLQPMYARIMEKYKAANPDSKMFFEPGQFPDEIGLSVFDMFINAVFDVGFSKPPGGEIGSKQHVLNDHSYCCQLAASVCAATGEPPLKYKKPCYDWHDKRIGTRNQNAKKLGIPFFLSEFGACMDSEECVQEVTSTADVSDKYLTGWAYWQFKTY